MGRIYRTRSTVKGVMRIELRHLLDKGYLIKGSVMQSSLSWTNGSTIGVVATYLEDEISLELSYKTKGENVEYKINLVTLPSNLGKGEILYFVCPKTGRRCRILYKAYGSLKFMSRWAYRHRLYYEIQTSSKQQRDNNRYFLLEKRLDKLYQMRDTYKYKGKLTKRAKLIQRLENKQDEVDLRRWTQMLKWTINSGKP